VGTSWWPWVETFSWPLAASDLATAATVERAAAGDEGAFARIVATHRTEMVRVAYVVSGDWDLAQDAA
jgi:hypothetical protein